MLQLKHTCLRHNLKNAVIKKLNYNFNLLPFASHPYCLSSKYAIVLIKFPYLVPFLLPLTLKNNCDLTFFIVAVTRLYCSDHYRSRLNLVHHVGKIS